jgi:hypothetical protein
MTLPTPEPTETPVAISSGPHLTPLTSFGVLEGSFNIYRKNFVAMIGLAAPVMIPSAIIVCS